MAFSAPLFAAEQASRAPLAFSTLGCPKWEWTAILDRAVEWGYAGIELRGLQGEMDLPKRPEFARSQLPTTLRQLHDQGLKISDLGASTRLHESDATKRSVQLDDGRRFIDLAHQLSAPYVRVFGDRLVPGEPKQSTVDRIVAGLRELGEHAKGSGVGVLIESHGDFCDSPTLREILTGAEMPNVGLLWDAHHTVVVGQEDPAVTLQQLGRYVHHVHLKDSKPAGTDVRYVLTGTGTVPLRRIAQLLKEHHYAGYYCFEWEKVWHPEIDEPEIAFPQYAKVMREYLS
jgi:sugar phosphate isomerase/epimerase